VQKLETAKTDEAKAKAYLKMINFYYLKDEQKRIEYADEGIPFAEKCNCYRELYWFKLVKASAFKELKRFGAAEEMYREIEADEAKFKEVVPWETFHGDWGDLYTLQGDYDEAIQVTEKGLAYAQEKQNLLVEGAIHTNIGAIYLNTENIANARKHFQLAIDILKQTDSGDYLANTYSNMAYIAYDDSDFELGLLYLDSAYQIYKSGGFYDKIASNYAIRADFLKEMNRIPESIQLSKKTLESVQPGHFLIPNRYFALLRAYSRVANYDSAKYYAALAIPFLAEDELPNQIYYHQDLTRLFVHTLDTAQAIYHFEQAILLSDSLHSSENQDALSEFQVKYETADKELEIARRKTQNTQLLLGSIIALLLTGGIFLFLYNRSRIKKREAEIALRSEQQEAERLRELDTLKSRFFTNISHELRTPLTLIAGPLEKVLEKGVAQAETENEIVLAKNNSYKLLNLVNEIMDLSKLESGKLTLNTSAQPLYKNLKRMFWSFESLAKIKGIELDFVYRLDENLWVETDVEKLEKVINNLVSNAIKFTESGQRVQMRVLSGDRENTALIQVEDSGIGISSQDLPYIFDRFYQSTSQNAPLQGGTGVGLALSRELARLLGGDLTVESKEGKGSIFSFIFPYTKVEVAQANEVDELIEVEIAEKVSYEPILIHGEKPKVLIVEDNPEMGEYLASILKENYRCTLVTNGADALKHLQTQHTDLVTSDVMMPVMDGFALRAKINERDHLKTLPFVFVTARALEEDKLHGLSLGVDDYITKPFSSHELVARVHNLLSNKIERDAHRTETAEDSSAARLNADERLLRDADCLLYTSPSPRDRTRSRMPSSA